MSKAYPGNQCTKCSRQHPGLALSRGCLYLGAACPADSRSNQNRQRAASDNAGCWLDSDRDCHSLCSLHADGLVRDTNSLEPYKRIVSPTLAPFGGALAARHKCVSSERM